MIYVKATKDRYLMIPSEFCLIDGVPDSIRSNPKSMRTLLNEVRYNPEQKMQQINQMVNKLFSAGAEKLAEWGISIEAEPLKVDSRRLAQPTLIHNEGSDQLFCNERLLKQMPVFNSEPLSQRHLVFLHDRQMNGKEVSDIVRTLSDCQKQIGMKCDRIDTVAVNYPRRADTVPQVFKESIG